MKVSIFDVAKKSGLSVVTVSRVLNVLNRYARIIAKRCWRQLKSWITALMLRHAVWQAVRRELSALLSLPCKIPF